jgi:endonuclease/exonuclease/phosphatase family metal-dependent hydrolase
MTKLLRDRYVCLFAVVLSLFATPLAAEPLPPTNLSAHVAGNAVTLTWNAPPGGVSGYRIEVGTAPGLTNAANVLVGATSSLFIPGVPAGSYYVRIRATASDGESTPSNEVLVRVADGGSAGCPAPPSAPSNLTAAVTGSVVTMSWTAGSGCGATNYVVHAGTSPGTSNVATAHVGSASTFTASGPDGVYYIHIVATNAYGSAASDSATVVIGSAAAPPAGVPPSSAPTTPSGPPTAPAPRTSAPSPAPAPRPGSRPAASTNLRVMTWNIHHGKTKSGRFDPLAQAKFIAAQNPDVVALQEVQTWEEDQPARYERMLEDITGDDWKRQWAPVVNRAGTEGNLILTRLSVVSSSAFQMHATGDWDALYSNRSAARMTVSVGGVNVHVFSTHLDYYSTTHRTAQLQDLMAWTAQYGARRIVAGDFNSTPGTYWITTMLGDYNDTWRDVMGSSSGGPTINGVRFDYLFRAKDGSDSVTPVKVSTPKTDLSDHAPVIADYKVTR